jgi:hypothetical protein
MKYINLIICFSLSCFVQNVFAGVVGHNFSGESWSGGKSCIVCHDLKNNLPKVFPPDSRMIDMTKLTPGEQAAFESNPNNISCLVCHQAPHSIIAPRNKSDSAVTMPSTNLPPGITSGSEGSVNMHVINRGANSLDCLQCHDLHNKDGLKMLRSDY